MKIVKNTLSQIHIQPSLLAIPTDNPEMQYQIGLYWFKHGENQKAEPWLRHAAQEGHDEAILLLRLAKNNGDIFDNDPHFVSSAVDIPETFITPSTSIT